MTELHLSVQTRISSDRQSSVSKEGAGEEQDVETPKAMRRWLSRSTYSGAVAFNILAFSLPALYSTLSKLWVAQLDSSAVVTTDTYTYIGVVAEVLNEGLPRAAYLIIADKNRTQSERLNLCFTLIVFQISMGLIMSLAFVGGAAQFASGFVPQDVRQASITYIRISAFLSLTSATETAVNFATRSLDRPDVPLIINLSATALNVVLDFMFISTFRIHTAHRPTMNTQAAIRLACDVIGSLTGLLFFFKNARRAVRLHELSFRATAMPRFSAWLTLARPGAFTFTESAFRNGLYLWLVHGVVALGQDYATAWGVFNTIRWGLVMVPVNALEAATGTFVGHAWNDWVVAAKASRTYRASWADLVGPYSLRSSRGIARPSIRSTAIALLVEIPLCLSFSFALVRPFAKYLSNSDAVADITARMWRTMDWCYIFYAVDTQMAATLLATKPAWYMVNSFIVNGLWVFPWCVALQVGLHITDETAWPYHATIFGGSLVLSFFATVGTLAVWTWRLRRGIMKL